MSLLGDQDDVSKKTAMPVNDVTVSTDIIASGTETIAFYYSNAGARTIDAGQAAGTAIQFVTDKAPVYNAAGSHVGDHNDTSFAFDNSDTFDAEKALTTKDYQTLARSDLSWASKLSLVTASLTANGQYKVDYTTGIGYGLKKDGDASETATYLTRGFQVVVVTTGGATSGVVNYTEDVATANPIVGSAVMMERDDIIGTLTPVAGDWASFRCSAEGALWTQDFNSDASLALLGTMDADTGAIKLAVEIMDDWDSTTYAETLALASDHANTAAVCYGMDANNGTPIAAALQVAVDNATISATPNTLVTGGIYKDALDTYNDNDAVPFHYDVNGQLITTTAPSASATTAPTAFRATNLDETVSQAVKASAGNLYGWNFYNPNSYDVFVKFYNTAQGSTTVGTTAVVETIQVPSLGSVVIKEDTPIKSFSTAITVAATKLVADADTTAITADVFAHIYYK